MNTSTLKSLLVTVALTLLAPNITLAQSAGGGSEVGGGGQAVATRRGFELRDLLPEGGTCIWYSAEEMIAGVPGPDGFVGVTEFPNLITTLERFHWLMAEELNKEFRSLTFCASNGHLRPVPPEAMSDVTVYLKDAVQVAVRSGVEVYLDLSIYKRMSANTKAQLMSHESMHGLIGLAVNNRDIKIRSMVASIESVIHGRMTAEQLALQIQMNNVDSNRVTAYLPEIPADVMTAYRALRDGNWNYSQLYDEERIIAQLDLRRRIRALPIIENRPWSDLISQRSGADSVSRIARNYAYAAQDDVEFTRRMSLLGDPTSLSSAENLEAFNFAFERNWFNTAERHFNVIQPAAQQPLLLERLIAWSRLEYIKPQSYHVAERRRLFPNLEQMQFIVSKLSAYNFDHMRAGEPNSFTLNINGRPQLEETGSLAFRIALRAINHNQPFVAQFLRQHFSVTMPLANNSLLSLAVHGDANLSIRHLFLMLPTLRSIGSDAILAAMRGNEHTINMIWAHLPQERRNDSFGRYERYSIDNEILTSFTHDLQRIFNVYPTLRIPHTTIDNEYIDYLEIAILSGNTHAVRVIANDPSGPLGKPGHRNHVLLAQAHSIETGTAQAHEIAEIVATAAAARVVAPNP